MTDPVPTRGRVQDRPILPDDPSHIGGVSHAQTTGCRPGRTLGTEEGEAFKNFIGKFVEIEIVELAPELWSVVAAVSKPVAKAKCALELSDERSSFSEVRRPSIEDVLVQPDTFRMFSVKVTKTACNVRSISVIATL